MWIISDKAFVIIYLFVQHLNMLINLNPNTPTIAETHIGILLIIWYI